MADTVLQLKEDGDMQGLIALKKELRGPVQLMQVNSALAEVLEEEEMWEEAAEAWRECLVLSPANPDLWERLGDVALKCSRVPLALSAHQAAYDLGQRLPVLLKVARTRMDLHDYANALALAGFVAKTNPELREAEELRMKIIAVMQGEVPHLGRFMRMQGEFLTDVHERQTMKVSNMTALAKCIRRQMELGKDDTLLIFQRVPVRDSFELSQSASRSSTKKQKSPLATLHSLAEDLKKEVLAISEPTVLPLFGLNPLPPLPNFKAKCGAEPCLDQFLNSEWRLQTVMRTIVTTLCSNSPRPSPALSDELGWEVLHLYLVAEPPMELDDEVLTLFELAMKDTEHVSTLQKLQQTVLAQQSLFDTQELQLRLKYALAWCYYHIGEDKSKDGDQADALISAYALLDEVSQMVGDNTYYFWWYGKVVNQASIAALKDNIKDEMVLTKLGEALKTNPKASSTLLGILSNLCGLLKKRCAKDDPAFYWRKLKIVIKNLSKCSLDAGEQLQYSQCLAGFLGVLQYNLEDGSKLSKDIDLKMVFKSVTKTVFSKRPSLRLAHEAYATIAAVNIVKVRTELFPELPFLVKKAILSVESMTQYFLRFHLLCSEYAAMEKDFHFNLCRTYEKPASLSGNSEALNIIYAQLYGFTLLHKDCPCKIPKIAPPDVSYPKSLAKLRRMLEYVNRNSGHSEDYGVYFPQTFDKDISPALDRCILRLPGLHLNCANLKQSSAIIGGLLATGAQCGFQHLSCCPEIARPVAEAFYRRYASDCFEAALMKESHASFLSLLDVAEAATEKLLVLNTRSERGWLLLGQIYLHKWMAGYFDAAILKQDKPEFAKYAEMSLQCFGVLQEIDTKPYGHIQLVRGLIQFLQYRLTGLGLLDAQRFLTLSMQSASESDNLETLMIAALLEMHMKSPQAAVLLEKINAETKGKYEYLRKIATFKENPSDTNWKELENSSQTDPYLHYVRGKRFKEEYREYLVNANNSFFASQKLFETKVMDRCCAFQRKRLKVARRYVGHFGDNKDLQGLFQLTRELGTQKVPAMQEVWQEAVMRLASLFKEPSDLSDLKFYYEFQDQISSSDVLTPSLKSEVLSQLGEALVKYQEVYGAEKCEALRPTKRRRKK